MGQSAQICLTDNAGRSLAEPLPRMQSEAVIRDMIRRGYRTAECFAELKVRNERVRAVMAFIAKVN